MLSISFQSISLIFFLSPPTITVSSHSSSLSLFFSLSKDILKYKFSLSNNIEESKILRNYGVGKIYDKVNRLLIFFCLEILQVSVFLLLFSWYHSHLIRRIKFPCLGSRVEWGNRSVKALRYHCAAFTC